MPAAEKRVGRAADAKLFLRGEIHHLAGFRDVDAERLLGMDMLAGIQNRETDVGVGERHREIDDDLDVVALEQLIDPHPRQPEGGALALCGIAAHIGERPDLHDREALGRLQIGGADIAAADDSDADFSHCDLRRGTAHPLTAPAVRPATMCFCARRNRMIVGRMVSVMKARIRCHSDEYSP